MFFRTRVKNNDLEFILLQCLNYYYQSISEAILRVLRNYWLASIAMVGASIIFLHTSLIIIDALVTQ